MSDSRARNEPADVWDRREFLAAAGFAILTVQCLPATVFASERSPSDASRSAGDLIIESGPGAFHHVHYLRIPHAVLAAPPARGAALTTSKALLHEHRIVLSQQELRDVSEGRTVTQRASSHVFVIALTKGVTEPPSG